MLSMYVYMYVCVCMYICMHVCLYVCIYVCVYVCMYVCMQLCMCMYVRMCAHAVVAKIWELASGLLCMRELERAWTLSYDAPSMDDRPLAQRYIPEESISARHNTYLLPFFSQSGKVRRAESVLSIAVTSN